MGPTPSNSDVASPSEQTVVPWEHRREIGRWKAYWWTVRTVMRWGGLLGRAVTGPVELRDARRFRWVTLGLAMAPLWVNSILVWLLEIAAREEYGGVRWGPVRSAEDAMAVLMDAGAITFWLTAFLYILTELAACVGCPARADRLERRRGAALAHYNCAPMAMLVAFTPVPFVAAGIVLFVKRGDYDAARTAKEVLEGVARFGALIALIPLVGWWQGVLRSRPSREHRGVLNSLVTGYVLLVLVLLIAVALSVSAIR